ncbi:hypothetical protein CPB85DRAFT_1299892 [Mucidula mucida]|nr:hypothetical protein CPB85DRAFT_1299892 [Mucidula mucida]
MALYAAYTSLAFFTLLVYDYVCTLEQEVEYIWPNILTLRSMLFLINRYMPFVDGLMILHLDFATNQTVYACRTKFAALTWLTTLGILHSEVILTLQTWALWEDMRIPRRIFALVGVSVGISCLALIQLRISTIQFSVDPDTTMCKFRSGDPIMIVPYAILCFYDRVLDVMTWISFIRRRNSCAWVRELHKTTLTLYSILFVCTILNLTMAAITNGSMRVFATPLRSIMSLLCNRVLFQLIRQTPGDDMLSRGSTPVLSTVFYDSGANSLRFSLPQSARGSTLSIIPDAPRMRRSISTSKLSIRQEV